MGSQTESWNKQMGSKQKAWRKCGPKENSGKEMRPNNNRGKRNPPQTKVNPRFLPTPQNTGGKQTLPFQSVEKCGPPNIVENGFSTTPNRGEHNSTTQNCETKNILLPLQIVGTKLWCCGQIVWANRTAARTVSITSHRDVGCRMRPPYPWAIIKTLSRGQKDNVWKATHLV